MKHTKDQLILRAIQVIDKNGYQNLSLRKLTAALNLTTGAFYKHFKDKDDLFKAVAQELSQEFIEAIDFNSSSPTEQLLQIADYFVNQMQKHPNKMEFLFFNDQSIIALKQKDLTYPFLHKLLQLIEQINTNSNMNSQDFFIQIWSFIQGYTFLIKNKVTAYQPDLVRKTLTEIMKGAN